MDANFKYIKVLITSVRNIKEDYFIELQFNNGDTREFKILEKSVLPNNIAQIVLETKICEIEILHRKFDNEGKPKKYKTSYIITKITELEQ